LKVWNEEGHKLVGDFSSGVWLDDKESISTHWGVFDSNSELVGGARLSICRTPIELPENSWFLRVDGVSYPTSYLSRDIITKPHQRKGIMKFIDLERIALSRELGAKSIIVNVPDYRVSEFERIGFKTVTAMELGHTLPTLLWQGMLLDLT